MTCDSCCLQGTDACPYVFIDNDEICDKFIKAEEDDG